MTKWDVLNAVKRSALSAPARLVMVMLVDAAEEQTAAIPERYTPSLTQLASWTGLGRSTVASQLNELEAAGWVVRERPPVAKARTEYAKTCYLLCVPSPGAGLVQETDQTPSTGEGLGLVQELDAPSPGAGHKDPHHSPPKPTNSSSDKPTNEAKSRKSKKVELPRADVDQLCDLLADLIAKNDDDGIRPEITDKWRKSARLLLDKDKRTVEQVTKAIEWCQADDFWHTNILSMPKLRKQYTQLQLKAKAERKRGTARASPDRPASTAPDLIPEAEKCEHRKRATTCGMCRAERIGRKS